LLTFSLFAARLFAAILGFGPAVFYKPQSEESLMVNWRMRVLLLFALLCVLSNAELARSQARTTTTSSNYPGPTMREGNRAMDDYDRTINRMRNDAKAASERRRSLFPQINEDFQRIQVVHNEIVRMLKPESALNYDRLADLTGEIKKRSARLRGNLALPEPEKTETQPVHHDVVDESHIKQSIGDLHDLIVSFVGNDIFKNLGVVDAKIIDEASQNLDNIINVSEEIKREAKILGKSAKN
jgi:hypothetical protein